MNRLPRWLIARRFSQLALLALFLAGPLGGYWLVRGNLASSLTLDVLPLTDPLILLQSLLAQHRVESTALIGAALVILLYLIVGGRAYCAWVCPINPVTDAAAWLRRRLSLRGGAALPASTRRWLLLAILIVSLLTGSIAWEWINPVTRLHRALIFGIGTTWMLVLMIFLLDAFVAARAWCGHLCPVGAFYAQIGRFSLLRVRAPHRTACDDCMDCFAVCPEPQVIRPALKAEGQTHALILDGDCSNCGRCIDICNQNVFTFATRFNRSPT